MELRLLLQPFTEQGRIGPALVECAARANALWLLTAWAQESGLRHLRPIVESIRKRRGHTEAILGVDQGLATYEGLRLALQVFDDVYLFHDGSRTFHPKLYVIEDDAQSRVIIGSGNVTEGGLYRNFEAAAAIDLDRANPLDEAVRGNVRGYFDSFTGAGMPFRRLDMKLLKDLRTSGAIVSATERTRVERERRRSEWPTLTKVFGSGTRGLPGAPPVPRPPRTRRGRSKGGAATGGGVVPAGAVTASWSKKLTRSDVMRKPKKSHQRRYVILGKAGHPIDQKVFFRIHFFSGIAWTQETMHTGRTKELAVVPFDVWVERRHLGLFNMSVDHAPSRVANQNNSPTWLNWSSLRDQILSRDYTDWYLLLERHSNGGFRLRLTRRQPKPAVVPLAARV